MKVEFQKLELSAASKLDILSSLDDEKEKYTGNKTDTENTIRKDDLGLKHKQGTLLLNYEVRQNIE